MRNKGLSFWLCVMSVIFVVTVQSISAQQPINAASSASAPDNECQSPVIILGAIAAPSRFELRRRVRLRELIVLAGGLTERAKDIVEILHTEPPMTCKNLLTNDSSNPVASVETYNLADVVRDGPKANPYLRPGDIVSIRESGPVFVIGSVANPQEFIFRENLTVSRVIAMAGGLLPSARKDKIYIHRPTEKGWVVIPINVKAVLKHTTGDLVLQPSDIVEVLSQKGSAKPSTFPICLVGPGPQIPLRAIY
jgi:hypothetical protein